MNRDPMNFKAALPEKVIWAFLGLVLLSVSACTALPSAITISPTSTPLPVISIDKLRFKDAETGRRFNALNACITTIIDPTWRSISSQLIGNSYETRWCRGAGADQECDTSGSSADARDQHAISLGTLFYPQSYPEVFGLEVRALQVPQSTGWGASFYFTENGQTIIGDGWQVTFSQYGASTGQPAATLYLGDGYSYKIDETSIDLASELSLRDDLSKYLTGPEPMRDRGLARIGALTAKVNAQLDGHLIITCDRGPYQGNGIPPACTPRPLNPLEEQAERAKADAYFSTQEQLLRDHYQEMYAAWMQSFPLDKCWP